jgi:hypothetical protein
MPLLDLPPEILQQSLLFCTTPSFFHAIRTCKELFQVAESSRAVLLHHLDRVPGITLGLQDPTISTKALFLTLRRRGSAHLFGLSISADCNDIYAGYGTIDSNASWLADNTYALVLRGSFRVRLYDIENTSCKLKYETVGGPSPSHGIGKVLKVVTRRGRTHTLFSYSPHLVMGERPLQEQPDSYRRPSRGNLDHDGTPLVDTDISSLGLSNTYYYVAVREDFSNDFSNVEMYFHIPAPAPWLGRLLAPIELAVHGPLVCAILWDLPGSIEPSIFAQVIKYTATEVPKAGATAEYRGKRIWPLWDRPNEAKPPELIRTTLNPELPHSLQSNMPPELQPLPGRVTRALRSAEMTKLPRSIDFSQYGRRIKIFAPGNIVPFHVAGLSSAHHRTSEEDAHSPNPFLAAENPWRNTLQNVLWNFTTAFYSYHATRLTPCVEDDTDDRGEVEQICTTSYLSLATTKISRRICPKGWTKPETEVLCVMRAVKTLPSNDCTHLAQTDLCTPIQYGNVKAVARLWGWQPSESSLAGEQKLACCDTRIAIAEWDRIFIWSLDSRALLDEADDPPPESNRDDESVASSCTSDFLPAAGETRKLPAWTYPKIYDAKMETWYVELKPIVLSTSRSGSGKIKGEDTVVIRQLMWKDPNTLVVRTGSGLQIWNLGPNATGKRTHEVLEMDTSDQLDCYGP